VDGTWTDAKRSREIPYRIYAPADATNPCPVIVFSHGLGGTREGYGYLGTHWASNGYIVIHLQHPGSDDAAWRGGTTPEERLKTMQSAAANLKNSVDRPRDVSFAIDQLPTLATNPALRARPDTNRIGIAGHSFGGYTTLAVAGQKFGPRGLSLGDPRVKAGIPMGAPVQKGAKTDGYKAIQIPLLHMSGTRDDSIIGDTKPAERRVPFDNIDAADQYFVNFIGGDHMVFSGQRFRGDSDPTDPRNHRLIQLGTLTFWNAYLRDDPKAKAWLRDGGYAKELGEAATLEKKIAPKN
jgi:predicted dienelactone hydrolase